MKAFLQTLTDFIFVEDTPAAADIIFVPGGMYGAAICERAAALWHEGFAPLILPSGKFSKLTGSFEGASDEDRTFDQTYTGIDSKIKTGAAALAATSKDFETEWDYLRALLLNFGVAETAILKENRATFTYENALFSKEVTDSLGMDIKTAIICCQAYHARRCLLYYECVFPDTKFLVCPAVTRGITRDNWYLDDEKMNVVLGEIERCGTQFHEIIRHERQTFAVAGLKSNSNF